MMSPTHESGYAGDSETGQVRWNGGASARGGARRRGLCAVTWCARDGGGATTRTCFTQFVRESRYLRHTIALAHTQTLFLQHAKAKQINSSAKSIIV